MSAAVKRPSSPHIADFIVSEISAKNEKPEAGCQLQSKDQEGADTTPAVDKDMIMEDDDKIKIVSFGFHLQRLGGCCNQRTKDPTCLSQQPKRK